MYRIRSGPDFKSFLTPKNSGLMLIDYQTDFVSESGSTVVQQAVQLYRLAKALKLPVAITNLVGNDNEGTLPPEFGEHVAETDIIKRRNVNAWANEAVRRRVQGLSVTKIVLAGAVADVSLVQTCLSCLSENYDVYVVWEACLALSPKALELAQARLVQAGVVPTTLQAVEAELTGRLHIQPVSSVAVPSENELATP